jgi:hypothetical protein
MVTTLPSGIVWAISAIRSLGMWLCESRATMSVGALTVDRAALEDVEKVLHCPIWTRQEVSWSVCRGLSDSG